MRKFWTIFGLRTPRLHFAHNTKNGFMTIERSKLYYYFFLVMHLHTDRKLFPFSTFVVHFGCTLSVMVHLALKRWNV